MRRLVVISLVSLVLVAPARGRAGERVSEVIHSNARVLEKGETIVGVITPLAFGILEKVTVFTHPALHLLLTPNFWGRVSVLDGRLGLALEGGYQQSFLSLQESGDGDDAEPRYPGLLQLGGVFSFSFNKHWQASLGLGYLAEFDTRGGGSTTTGWYYRAVGQWLITRRNLVQVSVRGSKYGETPMDWPLFQAIFARQFGRMRLGGGLSVGEFVIDTGGTQVNEQTGNILPETRTLPVYPWLDAWWRF